MCLSTAALAAFLTLIGAEIVTSTPDRITVHAETRDVLWTVSTTGEEYMWCTLGPQLDHELRFEKAANAAN